MLFNGEPGSGKTSLARSIAEIVSPEFFYIDLSMYEEAFQIAGLALGYSSSEPGLIFKNSSQSKYINNYYICDEAEKSPQGGGHRTSPLIPLYQLLENTSKNFTDVCMQIKTDQSYNTFLFTTNDKDILPEAILSRCIVFNVPNPTKKMVVENIANSVWDDILKEAHWGNSFKNNLSLEIRNHLSDLSVRDIKNQLKLAAAAAAKRTHKSKSKKINLLTKDFIHNDKRIKYKSIGFI